MAASLPRDRLILLVGLITYGMGQSLLFVIFAPLTRRLGIEEWQLGFIIAASNVMLAFSAPRWGAAPSIRHARPLGRRVNRPMHFRRGTGARQFAARRP